MNNLSNALFISLLILAAWSCGGNEDDDSPMPDSELPTETETWILPSVLTSSTANSGSYTSTHTYNEACKLINVSTNGFFGSISDNDNYNLEVDIEYGEDGRASKHIVSHSRFGDTSEEWLEYTTNGYPMRVVLKSGSRISVYQFFYKENGQLLEMNTETRFDNGTPNLRTLTFTYTGNNITKVTTWDEEGNIISESEYEYSSEGINHHRALIDLGYFPFTGLGGFSPFPFSENLVVRSVAKFNDLTTTVEYNRQFDSEGLYTSEERTINSANGTTVISNSQDYLECN